MGSFLSKPPPPTTVKPRDSDRVRAARERIEPIIDKLSALNEKIEGKVLVAPSPESNPDDAEQYHTQRERPFYFNDCNYPSAIVLVKTVDDVCETIKFVNTLERKKYVLCIAGGCHSNYCMVDNTIVVDMQQLDECKVHIPENKDDGSIPTITISGGAKIEQAHAVLKGTGYGFVTGTNGDTGVSGLTLAGGGGYLGGQAGYACDTVTAVKVVLPNGTLVTATDDNEHNDLMRAIRGGGGNFGVVVEWTFKLFDVTHAFAGQVVYMAPTVKSARKVMTSLASVLEDIPDQAGTIFGLPAGAPVVVILSTYIGKGEELPTEEITNYKDIPYLKKISNLAGAWFRASNDLGRKDYIDEIAPMLEPVQQRAFGVSYGAMVYSLDESMRDALIHFTRVEHPKTKNSKCIILVMSLHGEMRRNDGLRSSLRHRKSQAWVIIESGWEPNATKEEIQAIKDWGAKVKARIVELGGEDGPHNFCDTDGRRIKFFNDEQRIFLEQAKKRYDPDNLFSLNKNISYAE
jgi:FAD/FMN-containing dehydrogenase